MKITTDLANIEVSGLAIKSYLDAMQIIPSVAQPVFAKNGIGALERFGRFFYFDITASYSLTKLLSALCEVVTVVGPEKAFEIGTRIPNSSALPTRAVDLVSGLRLIDIDYHDNHLSQSQAMLESIGHYQCIVTQQRNIVMEVDSPYPCSFDHGIIQAWSNRLHPGSSVVHLEPVSCRSKGAGFCRYAIKTAISD